MKSMLNGMVLTDDVALRNDLGLSTPVQLRQLGFSDVENTAREVSIDYIQKVVCDYFDLPIELLKSKTRKREIVQARQISMYFAKKMTKSSLANIGLHCGGKDHATVLHACRTVNNLSETDKHFRKYLEDLEKKLAIH